MVQKVIDIIPVEEKEIVPVKEKKEKKKRKKHSFVWLVFSFLLILVIAFFVLSLNSRLTVALYPKMEEVTIQEQVEVSLSQSQLDLEQKILPGKFFETEEERWNTFPSTGSGQEGGKAEGVLTVYNSHSPPRAMNFVENTRFLSAKDGKTFRAKKKIYLPPAEMQGGKLVPSSVEVEVIAQESGESYNIPASKFSVPGLSGSPLYYSIWAESTQDMKGGFESEVKVVTEDDLSNGKESLKQGLEESLKKKLLSVLPEEFLADKESLIFENFESSCFQEEGDEVAEFNCYAKMTAKGLGFKKQELLEIVKHFILASSLEKKVAENYLEIAFSSKGSVTQGGSIVLDVQALANVYQEVNEELFISNISGMKKTEIESAIQEAYPEIERAELDFFPFWKKTAPKKAEKIKVNVVLD